MKGNWQSLDHGLRIRPLFVQMELKFKRVGFCEEKKAGWPGIVSITLRWKLFSLRTFSLLL